MINSKNSNQITNCKKAPRFTKTISVDIRKRRNLVDLKRLRNRYRSDWQVHVL